MTNPRLTNIHIRYRCFDVPSLSCKFNYMVPVGVGVGYVVLYLLFKTMFAGLSYYQKEECIDITETLEVVSIMHPVPEWLLLTRPPHHPPL